MELIEARWTTRMGGMRIVLKVKCYCNHMFEEIGDKWEMVCPRCSRVKFIGELRNLL